MSVTDVVEVAGFKEALVYAFKADNSGPPNAAQVAQVLGCIRNASGVGLFPGSSPQITGSTFDAFLAALLAHPTAASSLPVVTSEIGIRLTLHLRSVVIIATSVLVASLSAKLLCPVSVCLSTMVQLYLSVSPGLSV